MHASLLCGEDAFGSRFHRIVLKLLEGEKELGPIDYAQYYFEVGTTRSHMQMVVREEG